MGSGLKPVVAAPLATYLDLESSRANYFSDSKFGRSLSGCSSKHLVLFGKSRNPIGNIRERFAGNIDMGTFIPQECLSE